MALQGHVNPQTPGSEYRGWSQVRNEWLQREVFGLQGDVDWCAVKGEGLRDGAEAPAQPEVGATLSQ